MAAKPVDAPRQRFHRFVQWFDTLFMMGLCFVTLLATMLLRGKVLVGEGAGSGLDYSFGFGSCILVLLLFGVYIVYMLVHSERELKDMVNHVYGPKPDTEPAQAPTGPDPAVTRETDA